MNKRRLLKLARLLEADAKNAKGVRFDLNLWGVINDEKKPVSCGTTACAMGLAVVSGVFKRDGLLPPGSQSCEPQFRSPVTGRVSFGFAAAARLFEISIPKASFLFSAVKYQDRRTSGAEGERAVAKRIREFVAAS